MVDVISDVSVINNALGRIGGGAISSRDEETPLAASVRAVYDDLVDVAHTAYHWKWTRRTAALQQLADVPLNGWNAAFAFPADALGPPEILLTDPRSRGSLLRDFSVDGRTVYCNHAALWGTFAMRHTPDLWPPLFRGAFTAWLAASLAVPISSDLAAQDQLTKEAIGTPSDNMRGGLMGRAIAMDAAGGGNAVLLGSDPLTEARYSGDAGWAGNTSGNWWGNN